MRALPDLTRRDERLELMEDPDLPRADLDDALRELRKMNRAFGGIQISTSAIAQAIGHLPEFTMLDVGSGDGEIPRQVARWATEHHKGFEALGIDLTPASIELAQGLTPDTLPIHFALEDLFDLSEDNQWDVVHTSLVLHHLTDDEASEALAKMVRLARVAVIVNDLHRSRISWIGAKLGARLVTRCHVVHADAPHSVARAFRRHELLALARRSGASDITLRWRFPYRWLLRLTP